LAFGEVDLGETLPAYSPLLIELELVEIKWGLFLEANLT
jgi:hypothetical protein